MYKFVREIVNINTFSVNNNLVATYSKEGRFLVNNKEFYIENEKILGGHISSFDILNIVTENKVFWYHKLQLFLITKHLSGFMSTKIIDNVFLFRDENLNYCAYDLIQKNIVNKYAAKFDGKYPSCYYNECLLIHKFPEPIIQSLSLLTGEYEWETDLSHYSYKMSGWKYEARIQQVIGVWEGQLLVWMEGNKFLSLSVATGELLWEIRQWEYSQGKGHGYQFGQGVHLDEAKGKCYLFEGTCYMEIDLATQKATILWQEDLITHQMRFARPNFTEEYIYFLTGGVASSGVGVFNRKTLQIEWLYQFEFDESADEILQLNQTPQVADNKLYVLDTGGTLHIFERSEESCS
jgi:hypothetical protein